MLKPSWTPSKIGKRKKSRSDWSILDWSILDGSRINTDLIHFLFSFFLLIFYGGYPDSRLLAQPTVKLLAADGVTGSRFGNAVSVSGNTLVVGANLHDELGEDAGAAYIYQKEGGSWQDADRLFAGDGEAGDGFGVSVAIDGSFLIVGALGDDDAGSNAGAAYIYQQQGPSWVQHTKLIANDGAANDGFGFSVDIRGRLAIVGARGVDENGNSSGAAYIFLYANDAWVQLDKLTPRDGSSGDLFGSSVAISEFYAVAGAVLADGVTDGTGAVYVFQNRGAIWLQHARLIAGDGDWLDQFGAAVALDGNRVVVGVKGADAGAVDAGAAYVFEIGEEGVMETARLVAEERKVEDFLGYSVTSAGNFVVLGAPGDDDMGPGAGAAYVFEKNNGDWLQVQKLRPEEAGANQVGLAFGTSVGAAGEWVAVGAPGKAAENTNGDAYLFDISTVLTGMQNETPPANQLLVLHEIYPNPVNTEAYLSFHLYESTPVTVEIYDVTGRRIRTLVHEVRAPGKYREIWEGEDAEGRRQPAGVYVVRVQAGGMRENVLLVRI